MNTHEVSCYKAAPYEKALGPQTLNVEFPSTKYCTNKQYHELSYISTALFNTLAKLFFLLTPNY